MTTVKCLCSMALLMAFALATTAGNLHAQGNGNSHDDADDFPTKTPIKHVVVIFQENVSFDHYFGTYPHATNPAGEPAFHAKDDTPRVNNLESSGLLVSNPNGANPVRIDRSDPNTCDQDHKYGDEQFAFDGGLMDRFLTKSCVDAVLGASSVLDYYDGNTVSALWNYAQHFAMSDNHFGTTFGPSTPGAMNVIAGQTFGGSTTKGSGAGTIANGASSGAVIGDADPGGDMCSASATQITMSGKNIGDLLNAAGITWGGFMGGFANCALDHAPTTNPTAATTDYVPHHAWFQYWASTENKNHTPPSSPSLIGKTDGVTFHQYDLSLFMSALQNHNLPAVSYLKAIAAEDGHAGYSDPLDEQIFLVNTINALMQSDEWKETAVIITWDDSDGWYDHVMGPIVNQSDVSDDRLLGTASLTSTGNCGTAKAFDVEGDIQNGKCGFGPRIPLFVISPWARENYVDHKVLNQASVVRFIEDNWSLGRIGNDSADATAGKLDGMFDFDDKDRDDKGDARTLILNPGTGQVVSGDHK
jgi:phospholipase C